MSYFSKVYKLVFLIIFLFIVCSPCNSNADSSVDSKFEESRNRSFLPNFYFKAKTAGIYQHHEDYELIQPQDETAGTNPGEPNQFEADAWGWAAGGTVGYFVNERLAIETNATCLKVRRRHTTHVQGGDNNGADPTLTSLLPILDGTILTGGEQSVEIGAQGNAPSATAAVLFKYRNKEYDAQLDGIYTLFDDKKYCKAAGIFGIGYAFFDQKAIFDTTGVNFDNGNDTYTHTYEWLKDHMVGPRCGLRGELNVYPENPAVSIKGSLIHSLYVTRTHFRGEQDFTNASVPDHGAPSSFSIDIERHDTRVVPRLQCEVSLVGKSKIDCEIFYTFDCWWNMSTVDNPKIILVGGDNVIDHAVKIGTASIYQHFVGGRIIW